MAAREFRLGSPGDREYPSFSDLLTAIGPQRAGESLLARRVRFHQSWYRAAVLGRTSFGETMGLQRRQLGSILTDADAQAGLNFTSIAARRLFKRRHAEGWGIDPVRTAKYLTSSQTLMLNLFGLLAESPGWSTRVLREILQRSDIEAVNRINIEYAPRRRSEYLHDMTRLDVLVSLKTSHSVELLAIEIKYSDRFNSRRVDIDRPPYRKLATDHGLWRDTDRVLHAAEVNQLVRCHALTVALSAKMADRQSDLPTLIVLHHESDATSSAAVDRYRTHLHRPSLARGITLNAFVDALRSQARSQRQRQSARTLELRYVDESHSEQAWEQFTNFG